MELDIVRVEDGKLVRRFSTQASPVAMDFAPGRYRGQLSIPKLRWRSASRRFDVIDPQLTQTSSDRRLLIQGWLKGTQSIAVNLEQGL